MATTNLNIRTDKAIKDQAEEIFNELGLNMTTAINIFLRTAIREHGIPFELKLEVPNDTTAAAIEEGRKMMKLSLIHILSLRKFVTNIRVQISLQSIMIRVHRKLTSSTVSS